MSSMRRVTTLLNPSAARWAALLCAALASASAAATALEQNLPTPGLYRIDSDSNVSWPGAAAGFNTRKDGASGDTVTRTHANGATDAGQLRKGKGPVTHCVDAPIGAGAPLSPGLLPIAGCAEQSTTATADGMVHKAKCPSGTTTLTIRKIDSMTWDYVTVVEMNSGGADMNSMRPVLEHQAKHAATSEAREKATKQLADLPRLQGETNKQQAAAAEMFAKAERTAKTPEEAAMYRASLAMLQGKTPLLNAARTQRWTRIADSCASGSATAK